MFWDQLISDASNLFASPFIFYTTSKKKEDFKTQQPERHSIQYSSLDIV